MASYPVSDLQKKLTGSKQDENDQGKETHIL